MADHEPLFSEPGKWAVLTAFGILIREILGRLRKSPRPNGYLTKAEVQALIDAHTVPVRGMASLSARMGILEDRAEAQDAQLTEILRRLDLRGHGAD